MIGATPAQLLEPSSGSHIALLYDDLEELHRLTSTFLNEGLKKGELCIYATVRARERAYMEKVASMIDNYDQHIRDGNLEILDLASFYLSAMMNDLQPFEEQKKLFAEKVKSKQNKFVRFIGDGTGFLFENDEFDPCSLVERWWHENSAGLCCICPYHASGIKSNYHQIQFDRVVAATHTLVIKSRGKANALPEDTDISKYQERSSLNTSQDANTNATGKGFQND